MSNKLFIFEQQLTYPAPENNKNSYTEATEKIKVLKFPRKRLEIKDDHLDTFHVPMNLLC